MAMVLDGMALAVFIIRPDGSIAYSNRAAGNLAGPGRFGQFEPARQPGGLLAAAAGFRAAIAAGEFVLHYQPKVDLATGRCWGVEALVRWEHPDRGLLYPDSFIPLAEGCGAITDLTKWVLTDAVRQCRAWQDQGVHLVVSVNLSPHSLMDDAIIEVARGALEEFGVPARALEVELTETAVMEDPAVAMRTLSRLAALGITCAIDDFGTGFSSLVYLRELPLETIKIDRSFVMQLDSSDRDSAIVQSTIRLARSLGKKVVAEGVENQAAVDRLRELGCDTGQGYHWSRALPASDLLVWLRAFQAQGGEGPVPQRRSDDPLASPRLIATRALLRARHPGDVLAALIGLVEDLGGTVASADPEVPGSLGFDLTLGEQDAVVAVAEPGSLARRLLEQVLPVAIADARIALERLRGD